MAPRKLSTSDATAVPCRSARLAGMVVNPDARVTKTVVIKNTKPPTVTYECSTCYEDLPSRLFPNDLCSPACAHLINTSKKCIKLHITHQLEVNTVDNIRCPERTQNIDKSFVTKYATPAVSKRWEELERRKVADTTPGWRLVPGSKVSFWSSSRAVHRQAKIQDHVRK